MQGSCIDVRLEQRGRHAQGATADLADRLRGDLNRMRQAASYVLTERPTLPTREDMFDLIINHHLVLKNNPVLLCVIASAEGLSNRLEGLLAEARAEFLTRPFDYLDVFGQLLPNRFAELANEIAYRNGQNATAEDDFPVFIDRLDALRAVVAGRGLVGMPTGLRKLDNQLSGIRGITFLAGPKGVGKTMLMLSAVRSTLERYDDAVILILSFDEPKDRLYQRLFCLESGITFRQLLQPSQETAHHINRAKGALLPKLKRLRIVERLIRSSQSDSSGRLLSPGYDLESLWWDCEALRRANRAARVFICVDLFQKWPCPEHFATGADQDHWRLDILDRLRRTSLDQSCPDGIAFLVLSEIRKDASRELTIDDLKGDGRMASDADSVLLMYPSDERRNSTSREVGLTIRIAKGRDGVERVDLPLRLDLRTNRFRDEEPSPARVGLSTGDAACRPAAGPDPLAT
jgi:hypothetical protein